MNECFSPSSSGFERTRIRKGKQYQTKKNPGSRLFFEYSHIYFNIKLNLIEDALRGHEKEGRIRKYPKIEMVNFFSSSSILGS